MAIAAIADVLIVPLLPTFRSQLGLTPLELGVLVGATPFVMIFASLWLGPLTDRSGWKIAAIAGGVLLMFGALVQLVATTLLVLLLGRLINGMAYALIGTAVVTGAASTGRTDLERARATAMIPAIAGAAFVIGPTSVGLLAQHVGIWLPFVLVAIISLVLTVVLWFAPHTASTPYAGSMRKDARIIFSSPLLRSAMVTNAVAGFLSGGAILLAPLVFAASGESSTTIGFAFSLGSLLGIGSALFVRKRPRLLRPMFSAGGLIFVAVAFATPMFLAGWLAGWFISLIRGTLQPTFGVIAYTQGTLGAYATGSGLGTITGLGNAIWATTYSLVPVVMGLVVTGTGLKSACVIFGVCLLLIAALLVRSDRILARINLPIIETGSDLS